MMIAMAAFVANDTLVKLASGLGWPTSQIMALRGVFTVALVLLVMAALGHLRGVAQLRHPMALLRCGLEGFVAFTFITALGSMSIADVTAILMVSPLLITAASALLLGERVRWRRWLAVLAGFAGMLLVVKPTGESFGLASVLALLSTCGVVLRDLVTRRVPPQVESTALALGTATASMVTGLGMAPFFAWQPIGSEGLLFLAGASLFLAIGNYAVIVAFRDADASAVSPYRYTTLVWSVLSAIVVFGQWPDRWSAAGIALIIAAGLYAQWRERVLARQKRAKGS